jgi:hypothetical protein
VKKWINEDYRFTISVLGDGNGNICRLGCRNGHEIGDTYTCQYGCPEPMNRRCYKKAGFADTGKREVISDTLTLALYEKGRAT